MRIKKPLLEAFKNYFFNCANQGTKPWNSIEDFNEIAKAARENGFKGTSSIAGTFWLRYETPKGKSKQLVTDKSLFPKLIPYTNLDAYCKASTLAKKEKEFIAE